MFARISRHQKMGHYLLYSASFLFYGSLVTSLGPLIPFIANRIGILQTQCSSLYTCRSFGMLIGSILQRFLKSSFKKITNHSLMSTAVLIILLTSILFTISSTLQIYNIITFFFGLAFSVFQLRTNVGIIMINPIQDNQFWLLLAQGMFGVGGLIGPFFVYLYEMKTYLILASIFSLSLVFFCTLKSPETFKPSDIAQQQQQIISQSNVPVKIQYLLCLRLQSNFDGWISSYSILAGVNDKQIASLYPSIFWILMTLFRFLFAFIPGKSSQKLFILLISSFLTGCMSLILIKFNFIRFSCYLSSVLYGISFSSIYPLLFVINDQYGMKLSESQALNMSTSGVISQGIIASFVGYLMNIVSINMLFVSLIILSFILILIQRFLLRLFDQTSLKIEQNNQQKQKMIQVMQ